MSDRTDRLSADAALAGALRGLPPPAPERDLWPLLAARVRRRQQRRRLALFAVPAALAAALALALVLPAALRAPSPGIRPPLPATADATAPTRSGAAGTANLAPTEELTALRARSQRLERWVRTLDAGGAPLGGRALAGVTELEDMIGLVDVQLAAGGDARSQLPLWRQRVGLLEQIAALRLDGYAMADAGSATPTVWIN
ncbi:MAG TPA: hypothetical protein VF216_13000 [Mizugakiibacter sp.]